MSQGNFSRVIDFKAGLILWSDLFYSLRLRQINERPENLCERKTLVQYSMSTVYWSEINKMRQFSTQYKSIVIMDILPTFHFDKR